MAAQIMLSVLLLGIISVVTPQTTSQTIGLTPTVTQSTTQQPTPPLNPTANFGPLYTIAGNTTIRALDGSSPLILLQHPFVYFGQTYNQIYVNHNGHMTFVYPWSSWVPQMFPMHGSRDVIAPFWTDFDNRKTGWVYYNQYTNGSVLNQANQDINNYFPGLNFNADLVFVATWYEMAYYPNTGTKTTVQAVLISGGQYSFVLMNYGIIAPPAHNVEAGYDTVNSPYHFTVAGSFNNNATGFNETFRQGSNVGVLGRWAFRVDNGTRGCVFNCPTTPPITTPQPTPPLNPPVVGGPLYPIAGTTTDRALDGSSPLILLQHPFVYFGQTYNQIYVNHNGHMTFDSSWYSYIPQMFPMHGTRDIIAPFWTDFDNRKTGWVYYNQYTNGSVINQANQDINNYFPGLNFNADLVFVATWYEMAYFPNTGTKTTVQAVLISGGQYSFVLMNYGIIAPPAHNVEAGYDTVNSPYHFTVAGSFNNNATGFNETFRQGSNVGVLGRWAFRVDNGTRGCVFNCPTTPPITTPQPTPPLNPPVVGGPLYPIAGTTTDRALDGSSPLILLQHPFVYFGQTYNQIYVNHNGHMTFDSSWYSYIPQMFPMHGTRDIIAPFWTDFDNRKTGWVYYNQYTNGSVLNQANQDINNYFPGLNFNADLVFVATWYEMAYFSNTGTKTTVQAVLISGGQYSFVLMNYGIIAPPAHNVQAGYDTANSPYFFTISGSFYNIYAPANISATFNQGSNVMLPGRWAFRVDNGSRSCSLNGSPVQLGESFWSDSTCSQKCTCTAAGLQCSNQHCSFPQICQPAASHYSCQTVQKGLCTISGDPHYTTFDGTVFHFQGTCTYVLSEPCGTGLPYFRVESKNEHRGSTHVSWTRLVKVFVYNETIELVKGHHGEAKVNGAFKVTPISLNNGSIQVFESGFSLIVSTDFGLEVSYDLNHLAKIRLPYTYHNATCGLCGNFNNNPGDDFLTRQGELVSSDGVFANSWQASADDEPGCGPKCEGLNCAVCTESQTALFSNFDHCGILKNTSGPFAACHQIFSPESFAENCVFDLCVGQGYQPILCQALNVYASQCQQSGIQLGSWRSEGFCEIQCPSNSHFESQGTGCPATCANPNAANNCTIPNQESCICDYGFILSGGVCVPHAECGCNFEDSYYRSGETVILDEDCGRLCSCSYGSMTCNSHGCGPLESCSVVDGVRGCKPNSYATCWVKGPGSYHTFDGKTYQYPGACRLTLAKVMGLSNHPHFMVTTEKVPRGQQGFANVLTFEAEGTQISIEITASGRVKVDGQLIRLPFSSASNHIQISHSSIYSIIIHTSFGVTVQTVWPHYVRVTAPGIYNGTLGGLCGNYNGHPYDEFVTPNGNLVNNSQAFGDSWRDGSLAAHCVESRDHNSTTYNNSRQECDILGSPHGPFAKCWASVDAQQHIDDCVDTIEASPDPASFHCKVLQDYALMCQQKGMILGDWRNLTGCEQNCPVNSHYELCGSACPSSCPTLSFPFSCNRKCQEGCQCDDGFVLNGNQCVPPTDCGCYYQGRYRQGGEQFWDGECQNLCNCNGNTGIVHCSPSSCGPLESCRVVEGDFGCHPNPHGVCYASGDPHYSSFDGNTFDFQGTCRYVLATLCNATDGHHEFSVEGKNEQWQSTPYSITAEVFVNVWGYQVHMSRNNYGMVEINGITANLPILLKGGQISIYASGFQTFVSTDFGLSVTYDGWSTVTISVPSNYSEQTCGLCGNFNGDPNDDFQTPSGMIVNTPDEFGKAWKVAGNYTCSDGCGSSCQQCTNEQPARDKCELIQAADGPFSFCHGQVDPAPYFNDCVFDVCVSGNEGQDILCRAIQAYATACQSANVRIYPWRENTTCQIQCPNNTHYELCGTDCGQTCASSIDATCVQVCSEGCFCDEGFVRSGTNCVPVENCGCQYDGYYFDAGESFWTDDCSQQCQCYAPNDLRCSAASCTPAQECTIRNGKLGCFFSSDMVTCSVWGDPHYSCFDGPVAHFQGTCSYIVTESESHSINETQFQVVATNNHRGNTHVSFVSAVDVYLSNMLKNAHIRIGPNKILKVNGSKVHLPTVVGTLAHVSRKGRFIEVNAGDLIVEFDGKSTLMVRISKNRENRVSGMCGNFNGDSSDDKVLPNGTLALNDNHFGHSWKSPTSQPGCGSTDEDIGDGLTNCPYLQEYSDLCSCITNTSGPFSSCHSHSNPKPFYDACVYDLCLYTPANGMLCSAVSAYESTCSFFGYTFPEWRSALYCDEPDPCDELECSENEWCGERHGEYGCFCDEQHHRAKNESYDTSITCVSSTGTMSLSRCQLFEAGFNPSTLHLKDHSCNGTIQDGKLVFQFDNDEHQCGTVLRSNGTHIIYENTIKGDVDTHGSVISRKKNINLNFCCDYPLTRDLSMAVGINPLESIVNRKLPAGVGEYNVRIVPYQDEGFHTPFTGDNVDIEINQRLYVEVRAEGLDERQISIILDSCWATPVNIADYPVRWDLISEECPNPEDGTVDVIQNGISTMSRFSFKMFTFTDSSTIFLHCQVHLCVLKDNNCFNNCYQGHQKRVQRDVSYHDITDISVGPIEMRHAREVKIGHAVAKSGASGQLTSMGTLLVSLLAFKTLI